jgi:hypothetical protein
MEMENKLIEKSLVFVFERTTPEASGEVPFENYKKPIFNSVFWKVQQDTASKNNKLTIN